ncbi:MAG: hypothetical protein Q9190_002857 [Brigantiaea leucoxantha]
MMRTASLIARSAPLASDTFIYKILSITDSLISISSDDALRIVDQKTLQFASGACLNRTHPRVTCLESCGDDGLLTAGRDGLVRCWDQRSPQPSAELHDDGLVNIYDTSLADEDDALIHVFNHGSSVSHAGYLANDQIYALSHDEIFSMYTIGDADSSDSQERQDFGDLRPRLDCEYVVDMMHSSSPLEALTGAGSHSGQYMDLIPFCHTSSSQWSFDSSRSIRLPDCHGEDVVRSFCWNGESNVIFTAGEDGLIKAWQATAAAAESSTIQTSPKPASKEKKRKKPQTQKDAGSTARFNPY